MKIPIKAVAYYRCASESAEAIDAQRTAVCDFAKEHGIEIVHEEVDNGVSGLSLQRPGFERLMKSWILNDAAGFNIVLMSDISRLGRFDDPSIIEAYEMQCNEHGRKTVFLKQAWVS